jgi:hypothetical protein
MLAVDASPIFVAVVRTGLFIFTVIIEALGTSESSFQAKRRCNYLAWFYTDQNVTSHKNKHEPTPKKAYGSVASIFKFGGLKA